MLNSFAGLPRCLSLRGAAAALALARPLLEPGRARQQLHVFARRGPAADFSKVEVEEGAYISDLKDAVCAKLKLDAPPDCVRLLREEAGRAPVPLDSRRTLAEQQVRAGDCVLAEVVEAAAPPGAPAAGAKEAGALEGARRLLAALRAAELEPIAASRSSLIRLPEGALWPQLGAAPLFVRDFYAGLYEGPLASCDPGCTAELRKFIIRGNAGIGKSAFGAYVLWRAVKAGRTVVYASDKVDDAYIFHGSGCVEVFNSALFELRAHGILKEPSTVFICDGLKPPVKAAFTVLITSPKRERYREFFKLQDCEMLTVPVFFRHEVKDMLHTCFPRLVPHEKQVWLLYAMWGGIVRYVLAKQGDSSQWLLRSALSSINLDELIFHLGAEEIESDDKASHRLLHLKPVGEGATEFSRPYDMASYMLERTELASPHAIELVYNALKRRHLQRLNNLLAQPISSPSHARLYGDMYEIGAARALLCGGAFEAFDCSTGAPVAGGVICIPYSTRHVFSSVEDLRLAHLARQGQPTTFTPSSPSFTAVDAVLPGNALVNFTVNVKHELKMRDASGKEGVGPVADALGITGDIAVYWVLPGPRYKQACDAGKPFPVTRQHPGDTRKVRQYFVCVPFVFGQSGAM